MAGESETTRLMLAGWTMLAESCPVQGCLAPLFHNKRTDELRCTKCDGAFKREDGRTVPLYVRNPPSSAVVPRDELRAMGGRESQRVAATAPGAPSSASASQEMPTLPDAADRPRRSRTDQASADIGPYLIRGWRMLAKVCDSCGAPLMQERPADGQWEGMPVRCVFSQCDRFGVVGGDDPARGASEPGSSGGAAAESDPPPAEEEGEAEAGDWGSALDQLRDGVRLDEAGGPRARPLLQGGGGQSQVWVERAGAGAAGGGGGGGGSGSGYGYGLSDGPVSESKTGTPPRGPSPAAGAPGNARIRGGVQHSRTTDELMAMAMGLQPAGAGLSSLGSGGTAGAVEVGGLGSAIEGVRRAAGAAAARERTEAPRAAAATAVPAAGQAAPRARIAGAQVLAAPADWASMSPEELRAFAARAAGAAAEARGTARQAASGAGGDHLRGGVASGRRAAVETRPLPRNEADEDREGAELGAAMRQLRAQQHEAAPEVAIEARGPRVMSAPAGWASMTPEELQRAARSGGARAGGGGGGVGGAGATARGSAQEAGAPPARAVDPGPAPLQSSAAPQAAPAVGANPAVAALEMAAAAAAAAAAEAAAKQDWEAMGKASAAVQSAYAALQAMKAASGK